MFKTYDSEIKKILLTETTVINQKRLLENHKEMISKIQHERLIHLLVMIFTGTIMSLSFFFTLLTEKSVLVFLDIVLMVLFLGYLFHYRFLENTTQNWYKIEEEIRYKFKV